MHDIVRSLTFGDSNFFARNPSVTSCENKRHCLIVPYSLFVSVYTGRMQNYQLGSSTEFIKRIKRGLAWVCIEKYSNTAHIIKIFANKLFNPALSKLNIMFSYNIIKVVFSKPDH